MKLNFTVATLGFAASIALTSLASAQAAQLSPTDLGLASLSSSQPVIDGQSAPHANFPYLTTPFRPSHDLKVKFSLIMHGLGSRGRSRSSFGYTRGGTSPFTAIFSETLPYDGTGVANSQRPITDDWLGTCGAATNLAIPAPCERTVTFKAGQLYQLALLSQGISTYGLGAVDRYTFNEVSDQFALGRSKVTVSEPGSLFIGMEDGEFRKSGTIYWYDYQDWVVKAEAVPEPSALIGLGLGTVGALLVRRRSTSSV